MTTIEEILHDIRPEFDFRTSEDFFGDGMLDSFDMVLLVSELDKNFGISISGLDIVPENFQNIQVMEKLIGRYSKS